MAAIQGLLMQYKTRPHAAIKKIKAWVESERRKRAEQEGKLMESSEVKIATERPIANGQPPADAPDSASDDRDIMNGSAPSIWWPFGMI